MKIGVISDTHIPKVAPELPEIIYRAFKEIDLILHAGDLITLDVLDNLMKIAPTEAVSGNMDSWDVYNKLPKKKVIKALRFKIGLIHGWGHPKKLVDTITKEFTGVDVIIFGHSHEPMNEKRSSILYFNPGSPTDKIFAPYNSYGILEVGKTIKGRIIKIKGDSGER